MLIFQLEGTQQKGQKALGAERAPQPSERARTRGAMNDVISDNHLTNNICEGMNNRLMHRIGFKKASIYRVFQTLQSELDTAKKKVNTFCAGNQVKPYYRHRQTNTDQTQRNLKSQLETGNLYLCKYMRAMGALHSKTSLTNKKKIRTVHVARQEELAVTVTDGADPTVQIPSLPLLGESQTQQREEDEVGDEEEDKVRDKKRTRKRTG